MIGAIATVKSFLNHYKTEILSSLIMGLLLGLTTLTLISQCWTFHVHNLYCFPLHMVCAWGSFSHFLCSNVHLDFNRNLKKADWEGYSIKFGRLFNNLSCTSYDNSVNTINGASRDTIPIRKISSCSNRGLNRTHIWCDGECARLVTIRREVLK